MARLGLVVALLVTLLTAVVAPAPARAADPTAIRLATTGGYADTTAPLAVALATPDGVPVPGAVVRLERRVGGEWTNLTSVITDEAGRAAASAPRSRRAADNLFRATYDGDETYAAATTTATVRLVRRTGVVTLDGPRSVADERRVTLRIRSRTGNGTPVEGFVQVERSASGGPWRKARTIRVDDRGRAKLRVRPRTDTRWRAVTRAQDWVEGDRSPAHRVDNRPSGTPVRLPAAAPRPRVSVPRQKRATARGAAAVVTTIPDGVWASMVGRSWHSGCPVGRDGLRLLRINYWGYDGYRYRGEVVAATGAIDNMARALTQMYDARYPIRSMYRVDRFGWSARLRGANDYASMAAGNTSAFNCRDVVNRPGVRSPHAYGRALDVNTWENPYRSATGLVPNTWWAGHSHPRVAWRSRDHAVVRIFLRTGFRWTYGTGDSQHFDAVGSSGKVIAPSARACRAVVCH